MINPLNCQLQTTQQQIHKYVLLLSSVSERYYNCTTSCTHWSIHINPTPILKSAVYDKVQFTFVPESYPAQLVLMLQLIITCVFIIYLISRQSHIQLFHWYKLGTTTVVRKGILLCSSLLYIYLLPYLLFSSSALSNTVPYNFWIEVSKSLSYEEQHLWFFRQNLKTQFHLPSINISNSLFHSLNNVLDLHDTPLYTGIV